MVHRVFEAGNLYEWLVRLVLLRSGILRSEQKVVSIKSDKHLEVVGRLDFIGGGKSDWKQANDVVLQLKDLCFPMRMMTIAEKLIDSLKQKYPEGMKELLIEVKSVNSLVFWRHNKKEGEQPLMKAYPHHVLQAYTYMKALEFDEGRILYISKDDLTLAEVRIVKDEQLEKDWNDDVETMSCDYRNKLVPYKEDDIVFNKDKMKFEVNWQVARSSYLTKMTGLNKKYYEDEMGKLANRLNYRIKKQIENKEPPNLFVDYMSEELDKIYANKDNQTVG